MSFSGSLRKCILGESKRRNELEIRKGGGSQRMGGGGGREIGMSKRKNFRPSHIRVLKNGSPCSRSSYQRAHHLNAGKIRGKKRSEKLGRGRGSKS